MTPACSAIATAAAAAALALGLAGPARAALLAYEGFDYPADSPVAALDGGTGWDSAWTATVSGNTGAQTVQSPGLAEGGVAGTGNRLLISKTLSTHSTASREIFASNRASGTFWLSVMIDQHSSHSTSFGFAQLSDLNGTALAAIRFSPSGNWALQSGTSPAVATATSSSSPALLVARFDLDADQADLWVDPPVGGAAPVAGSGDATAALAASGDFKRLTLRVQTGSGSASTSFDEIRIGQTFADVTPVPEPASALAVTASGVGGLLMRRRRRAPAGK